MVHDVVRRRGLENFREDAETLPCRRHPLGCVSGRHDGGRVAIKTLPVNQSQRV